jgi:hypothetical protein
MEVRERSGSTFVGREQELQVLEAELAEASAARSRRSRRGIRRSASTCPRRGLYCSYAPDPRLAFRWEV